MEHPQQRIQTPTGEAGVIQMSRQPDLGHLGGVQNASSIACQAALPVEELQDQKGGQGVVSQRPLSLLHILLKS